MLQWSDKVCVESPSLHAVSSNKFCLYAALQMSWANPEQYSQCQSIDYEHISVLAVYDSI